jgi:cation transport regulator ChaC
MEEAIWNAEEGVWEGGKPPSCEIPNPLYIFGYGSLLWKPGDLMGQFSSFGCLLKGYQRIFAQRSTDHRGTPNFPGFVLTLIENSYFNINNDKNELYGKVWLIPDIGEIKTNELIDELDYRERGGYHRHIIDVKLLQSTPHHKEGDIIKAIVYSGSTDNPNFWYISQKDVRNQVADIISAANGPSGPNASYLINLYKWFKDNNIKDDYLEKLSLDVLRRLGPWRNQLFHSIKYNDNTNCLINNILIDNKFLIIIKDLCGWGSNEFGQIGVIDNNKLLKNVPERIHFTNDNDIQQDELQENYNNASINNTIINNNHDINFLVLSAGAVSGCLDITNQRLYLWGSSWIHSQDVYCDINGENNNGFVNHRIVDFSPLISVLEGINGAAMGHDHILLLLSNGNVIEIRDKSSMKVDSIPINRTNEVAKCVKLSAGIRRSAVITSNGRLYSYTDNIDLNFGGDHPSYWQMVDGLTIIDVSCGNKFTVFIDSIGRIWSFGSNKHLALGRTIANPTISSNKKKVTEIDCIPSLVTSLESNIIWQRVRYIILLYYLTKFLIFIKMSTQIFIGYMWLVTYCCTWYQIRWVSCIYSLG